jgi:hypothetical protein
MMTKFIVFNKNFLLWYLTLYSLMITLFLGSSVKILVLGKKSAYTMYIYLVHQAKVQVSF